MMIILFFMGSALFLLLPTNFSVIMKEKNDIQARFAADAGIQTASALISDDVQNGEIDEIPEELDSPSDSPLAPWNYQVSITPGPGNSAGSLLSYTLRSTGTDGIFSKKIVSMIEQESFGEYLIFTNSEIAPDGSTLWYAPGLTITDGPVFTNGQFNVSIPQGYYQNSPSPFFLSTATSVYPPSSQYPDGVNYGGGGSPPYDSSGNPIPGDYEDIYKGGRPDLITGAKPIPFPTGYSSIQNASWGNSSEFPAAPGVYVNTGKPQPPGVERNPKAAAGIYVSGSVDQILMGTATNTNNSMLTLNQGTSQYQITYVTSDPVTIPPGSIVNGKPIHTPQEIMTGNTILQNKNVYSVYQGTTNGTIFVNGNIGSSSGGGISGTVQGKYTIAASGDLYINGNIDYQDTTPGQPPTNSQDMLGLIGTNVIIGDSAPPNLMIYADIYAGAKQSDGSLTGWAYAQDYDTRQTGTLQLFGGVVSVYRFTTGTFNSYSGQMMSGYAKTLHYDPRLAQSPPPFFPTTGKFRTIYRHEE
ncbi:MAG: hypothetical protein M1169_05740 [Firmicutes bacterium]|nr:hypothetical protein [Bacillota bacterium]